MGIGPVTGANDDVSSGTFVSGTVTVGTSQVEAKVGGSKLTNRQELIIDNTSSSIIYYGPTGVTTSTGKRILKDQVVVLPYDFQVFLIAGSAGNSVLVQEVS